MKMQYGWLHLHFLTGQCILYFVWIFQLHLCNHLMIKKCDILINEIHVTSYKLISSRVSFIARVTSDDLFLLHELRFTFCIRVTSYCLLHELRVTFYIRVTSCCLFHELRVTVYCTSYELLFAYELRVTFYCTSHELYFDYELQ